MPDPLRGNYRLHVETLSLQLLRAIDALCHVCSVEVCKEGRTKRSSTVLYCIVFCKNAEETIFIQCENLHQWEDKTYWQKYGK